MNPNNHFIIPFGYRDIIFESAIKRKKIRESIEKLFTRMGYKPVIPPTVELSNVFLQGNDDESFYKLLHFFNEKGELLCLRADLTCSVARMVCTTLSNFPLPLKVYYIENIFRKVNIEDGKFIETTQAGVEIIGDKSLEADIEILKIAISLMKKFCREDFQIVISHVSFLEGLFEELSIPLEKINLALQILKKRSKVEWLQFLYENAPVYKGQLENLLDFIGDERVLKKAEKVTKNQKSILAIETLRKVSELLKTRKKFILFDLANVKRFNYYTGLIFSMISHRSGFPIGNGGRYDELIKNFGKDLPATGFSINIDLLEEVL